MSFEVYRLPKLPNEMLRRNFWTVKREKDYWHKTVKKAVEGWNNKSLEKAKITLTRHSSREPDFDGLCGSFKFCLDGLVKAGVILDDKVSVIGQPTYLWVKASPGMGKIEIKIEWEAL